MHPFEKANLGKAPFRSLNVFVSEGPITLPNGITVGSPGQPMGTCDYCGTGIKYCCKVESADNRTFVIGLDCANKLYTSSNQTSSQLARDPVYQEIKKEKLRLQRKKRHQREAKQLAEGKEWAHANHQALHSIPNYDRNGNQRGTLWTSYEWYLRHAGTSGNLKNYKYMKKRLDAQTKKATT